jgi:hypothetical protein
MKNLRCPAYITALIHYHCCPEPLHDSPVNDSATKAFLDAGLIQPDDIPRCYRTTPLGCAYIEALCLVPPPTVGFTDAAGNQFDAAGRSVAR